MSFFNSIYKYKKRIGDASFLWLFSFGLALCCVIFNQVEQRANAKAEYIAYTLYGTDALKDSFAGYALNDEKVVTTDSDVASASIDKLYAKYAVLLDATNRRVLYEKDAYKEVAMASTTKIMTLLVVLEHANLDDIVTVSSYAASMPDVQLGINEGEQYRLGDLCYSLMLESHNDTAVAIAEHVGGSVEGFTRLMNEKAKELGAYHTSFVTPNGLDAEGHYTTAYDLALIASYAIENEIFNEIVKTPSYTFHEQSTGRCFTVNNKDRFLTSYEGAIGIKTGFTGNAGYCFVGAAVREQKKFVTVVLASGWPPHKTYKWKDTVKLMDYGMNHFQLKEIVMPQTNFQAVQINDSIENKPIIPYVKDSVSLLLGAEENVRYEVSLPKRLSAPVKKDETIGNLTVFINDEVYKVIPLYSNEERRKLTYIYILKKIVYQYGLG